MTARKPWSIASGILLVMALSSASLTFQVAYAENYFNKNFEWYYKGYSWTWSLSIPQSLYDAYKRVSVSERTRSNDYSFLVTTQDSYVKQVANKLHEGATQEGYGSFDEVSFILSFVQSLPYTSDSVTTGYDEYPRFPIETLVDGGGDCEDTAILFATLVVILNYGTIFISPPSHLAVGVLGKDLGGYYFTYDSKTYYYCETTGDNWNIGDMPDVYKGVQAELYPIVEGRQYIPTQDVSPVPPTPGQNGQTTPFLQLPLELVGITAAGIVALILIVALALWAGSAKSPEIEETTPELLGGIYASDAEKKGETKETVERAGSEMFFCRYCGTQNKTDAIFCEKCGKKIG